MGVGFVVHACLLMISQHLSDGGRCGEEVWRCGNAEGLVEVVFSLISASYLKVFRPGTGIGDVKARCR